MGAPVGALLFSVEVTASYYLVSNLWKGFLCSIASIVTFAVIHTINVRAPPALARALLLLFVLYSATTAAAAPLPPTPSPPRTFSNVSGVVVGLKGLRLRVPVCVCAGQLPLP